MIDDWVRTCYCCEDCEICDKTPEQCRKDIYKILRVLLVKARLIPEDDNIKLYT